MRYPNTDEVYKKFSLCKCMDVKSEMAWLNWTGNHIS